MFRDIQHEDDVNNWVGPPHNSDMSIKDVQVNADLTCSGDWVSDRLLHKRVD